MNRPTFYRGAASSARAAEGAGEWQELGRRRTTTARGESSSLGPWGAFIEARSIATIGWYFEFFFFALGCLKCRRSKPTNGFDGGVKAPLTTGSEFLYSEFAGRREERRRRWRSRHAPSTDLECGN